MSFGDRMRAHRVRMGLTQEQVGDYLGKTKNNISQYELGKREPDLSVLVKLALLFATTADELLGCERPAAGEIARPVYTRASLTADRAPKETRRETNRGDQFYYVAHDDALSGSRILAGDTLLLRACREPIEGAYMLLLLEGEPILRLVRREGGRVVLYATDPRVAPVAPAEDRLEALGEIERVEFAPAPAARRPFGGQA